MQSYYINRDEGFQTHYLQWNLETNTDKMPVICIHGNLSNARMFKWIGEELSSTNNENPRQVVAIDIRGCGESGIPDKGFTLHHMASDIEAVLNHLKIAEAHFIAYSRGVSYVLQYALTHSKSIHGLVIGDYQAQYPKLNEEWAKRVQDSYQMYESWDEIFAQISSNEIISREEFEVRKEDYYVEVEGTIRKRYSKDLPIRMCVESEERDLSSALNNIHGKLLVLKGTEEGSLLKDEQLNVYEKYNPIIIRVNNAGHDVFEPRPQVKEAILNYFNDIV